MKRRRAIVRARLPLDAGYPRILTVVRKSALHPPGDHRALRSSEIAVSDETQTARERHEPQRAEARHGHRTRRFGVGTKLPVVRVEVLLHSCHQLPFSRLV